MNTNAAGLTHNQLQAQCWKRACNTYGLYGLLITIPNDGAGGNAVRAKQLQAIGVTPGVWDMVLLWKNGNHWFEFKVGSDRLSDNQKKFRDKLMTFRNNWFYQINDEDEFIEIIKNIMDGVQEAEQ